MATLRRGASLGPAVAPGLFGMHVALAAETPAPPAPAYIPMSVPSMRLWDVKLPWRALETSKGVFNWTRFDQYVAIASANNMDFMFTLGQTPPWAAGGVDVTGSSNYNPIAPTSDQDWVDYITAVVNRAGPRLVAISPWNEPNSEYFYNPAYPVNTVARLVQLAALCYSTVKALRSDVTVLSPEFGGFSGAIEYMAQFISAGGGAYFDVLAIHTYVHPNPPETIRDYVNRAKSCLKQNGFVKPVWNTEFAWGQMTIAGTYYPVGDGTFAPQSLGSAYVARAYLSMASVGVQRSYWYAQQLNYNKIQLTDRTTGAVLDAGIAYAFMANTFIGGAVGEIVQAGTMFTASFCTTSGRIGRAYWCQDDKTATVDLSVFSSASDCLGNAVTLSSAVTVSHSPILCFR